MKKERELSDMQKAFLEALADPANKGDIRTCMKIAGYSETVSPSYVTKSLQEEIIDVVQRLLAHYGAKAAISMGSLLDDSNRLGAKNAIAAANSILDRMGVVKKTGDEINLKVPSGGLFILPAKEKEDIAD